MQILKASTTGWVLAPARSRATIAAVAAYAAGAEFPARPQARNVQQRGKKRAVSGRRALLGERRLEVGEPPFGCNILAAEASPAPLRDWMQGRILQKLGRVPFNPGVWRLAESRMKLFDQARLSETGLADDLDKLALAGADAVPATEQRPNVLLTPDEGR